LPSLPLSYCAKPRSSSPMFATMGAKRPRGPFLSQSARGRCLEAMSASLIGHSGSSAFQTIHHYSVDVAHGLALLFGIGTRGPSIMGFEDEVEQSFGRPCRQTNGRSKRTCELTSSIVPRGTSFHRSVELECPSIGLDAARFFMLLLLWPVLGSSGTRCRQPICGA